MQRNQNLVRLIGQVAKDIEMGKVQNGHSKAVLFLTNQEVYINRAGEQVQQTGWYRAIATGKLADQIVGQLAKGDKVGIQGKLCHNKFFPKEGPVKQMTEIAIQGFFPIHKTSAVKKSAPLPF